MKKSSAVLGTKNVVGAKIEALRKEKGLKQKALASALVEMGIPMSPAGLSKLESQNRMVSDIELAAIAEILQVSVNTLLDGD